MKEVENMGLVYEMPHEVSYYECDLTGTMTVSMLVAVAIKSSEQQSARFNRGTDYIHSIGLNWIITDYLISLERLPRVGEKLVFKTEAKTYNRFFCYRSFWVFDQKGNLLVEIASVFALMNQTTRKLARVQDEIIAPYESEKQTTIKRMESILPVEKGESMLMTSQFYDIDENKHVNNAVYFQWLFSPLGFDFLTTFVPTKIRVRFEKEILYGSQSQSVFEKREEDTHVTTLHEISVKDEICCRAQIEWKKIETLD